MEVLPDFRRGQLAITAWFQKQKDEIRVPVTPDVDARTVRESGRRIGKQLGDAINDESRRAAVEREAMYARMFDSIERQERKAINERTQAEKQVNDLAEQIYQGRLNAIAKAHAEALRENARLDRMAELERQNLAREAQRAAVVSERELTRAHTEALRENARIDREAIKAREQMYRELFVEIDRREKEQLRSAKENAREIQRAYAEALREDKAFDRNQQRAKVQFEIDRANASEEAQKWAGGFTRALEREFYQRRVFITSIFTGALTAGGPAILAATSVAFAGIGAVAVSQSQRVQQAWSGTWQSIKTGAQADADVLVPVYTRMAGRIDAAFQDIRPSLRTAFAEVGPQIETMTTGLIGFTNNALPGMVRALGQAGPAVNGLSNGLQTIGSGLGEMFDILGGNSQKFGSFFEGLGSAVGDILPLLGELSGTAAEVGGSLLPLVGTGARAALGGLRALEGVLGTVGSSLGQVVAGFIGFRVMQNAGVVFARTATNIGNSMTNLATTAGVGSSAIGRAGGALSRIGTIAPGIGIALGALGAAMAYQAQQAEENAAAMDNIVQAYNGGGEAARRAAVAFDELRESDITRDDLNDAIEREERRRDSLTRSQRAAEDLAAAQRDLDLAMKEHGAGSAEAEAASRDYADAQAEVAAAAAEAERAIEGVTQAMAEQAAQAESRVDSEFAYQDAILSSQEQLGKVADAQTAYNDAVGEFGADSEEARAALLGLNQEQLKYSQSLKDIASAAADVAMADLPASMTDAQKAVLGANAALGELNAMLAMGIDLPPELDQWREQLIAITGQADGAVLAQAQLIASLAEVGVAASGIPGTASVSVSADIPPALVTTLEDLGFSIREVDGEFRITANTQEAQDNLGNLSELLAPYLNGENVPDPIPVEVDSEDAEQDLDTSRELLNEFNNTASTLQPVTLEVDGGSASQQITQVAENLAALPEGESIRVEALTDDAIAGLETLGFKVETMEDGSVIVTADTEPAQNMLDQVDSHIEAIDNARPTPIASLTDNATGVASRVTGTLDGLARQRPTPIAALIDFASNAARIANTNIQILGGARANPIASLIDGVSGPARAAAAAIWAIPNRTVTVSVVTSGVSAAQNIISAIRAEHGGVFHAYADGGFERALTPMSGSMAQIVPPNTWRVVGDRMVDDEAFIPINNSARSNALLRETALRMGYQLAAMDGGGTLQVSDDIRRMVAAGDGSAGAGQGSLSIAGLTVGRDLVVTDNADSLMRAADASKRRTMVELRL